MAIITTTKGDMDTSQLVHKTGTIDNEIEYTVWDEYYLGDELVHRSVHVTMKTSPFTALENALLG
jgi:hypothetical protein